MRKSSFKINSQNRWYLHETAQLLADGVKIKGWHRFKSKTRLMDAFYHNGLQVVVKSPKFIMEPRTPLGLRVPTVNLGNGWVAQPLLKKSNLGEALSVLRKQLAPYLKRGIFPDIHRGNVGWYNGKPLLFDW